MLKRTAQETFGKLANLEYHHIMIIFLFPQHFLFLGRRTPAEKGACHLFDTEKKKHAFFGINP